MPRPILWTGIEVLCACCDRERDRLKFSKSQLCNGYPKCTSCTGRNHNSGNCRFSWDSEIRMCEGVVCETLCETGIQKEPNIAKKSGLCHRCRVDANVDGRSYCYRCNKLTDSCAKVGDEVCDNTCAVCCGNERAS